MVSAPVHAPEVSQENLVRRWQAGDELAHDQLYEAFVPLLVARLRQRTSDHHLAEDLAQEAWLRASMAIGRFDPSRPLWPWLETIARNALKNHWRRTLTADGRPRMVSLDTPKAHPLVTDFDQAEQHDLRRALLQAVAGLSPKLRDAVVAVRFEELGYAEAAERLGVEQTTLRQRVKRALAVLRTSSVLVGLRALALVFLGRRAVVTLRDRVLSNPAAGLTLSSAVQLGLAGVVLAGVAAPAAAMERESAISANVPAAVATIEGRGSGAASSAARPGKGAGPQAARQPLTSPAAETAREAQRSPSRLEFPEFERIPVPGTERSVSSDGDPDKEYQVYGVAEPASPGDEPLSPGLAWHDEDVGADVHQEACDLARNGQPVTYCTTLD